MSKHKVYRVDVRLMTVSVDGWSMGFDLPSYYLTADIVFRETARKGIAAALDSAKHRAYFFNLFARGSDLAQGCVTVIDEDTGDIDSANFEGPAYSRIAQDERWEEAS